MIDEGMTYNNFEIGIRPKMIDVGIKHKMIDVGIRRKKF